MTKLEFHKLVFKVRRTLLHIDETLALADLKFKGQEGEIMSPDVADIIAAFDSATNAIASRIASLVASQGTLSAEDKQAFADEVAKLNALGAGGSVPA